MPQGQVRADAGTSCTTSTRSNCAGKGARLPRAGLTAGLPVPSSGDDALGAGSKQALARQYGLLEHADDVIVGFLTDGCELRGVGVIQI